MVMASEFRLTCPVDDHAKRGVGEGFHIILADIMDKINDVVACSILNELSSSKNRWY